MRGAVPDLPVAHSLRGGLPAAFFGNDFTTGFVDAFDQVLAPIIASLDNLDAYFDPGTAPDDFLPWLAGWVGLSVDERWPRDRLRTVLREAADAFRWRGTRRGIAMAVRAYTGSEPEVTENGAAAWSPRPNGRLPGERGAFLLVRVTVDDPDLDHGTIERIVADAKPAHVPHRVEVELRPSR